jgi:hypothetical protein
LRIHEVIIIPGAGHVGNGTYDRGRVMGSYAEVDLVDRYVATLIEELDNSSIRHRIAPTRKAPGLSLLQYAQQIPSHSLVLHCTIGWNDSKTVKSPTNISCVSRNERADYVARGLSDVIGHWGALYAHGHRTGKPIPDNDDVLMRIETPVMRLEPFQVNGAAVNEYAKWAPKLGRDIGRFVADYCQAKEHNASIRIQGFLQPRSRHG